MSQTRKMVNLNIAETSGVDHPAHQHEGWIVMKSAPAETVGSLFGSLNKQEEAPVAELTEAEKLAAAEARVAELEAAAAAPAGTQEPAAAGDGTEPAASGHEPAEATEEDALEKALTKMPEAIRKAFTAQAKQLADAQELITKERDERLDTQAIAKSKELFKSLAIQHDTVAPALRRVAAIDADLAKSIETALSAADAQLAAGTSLTKEVGKGGTGEGGSALETINKAAATLREEDPKLTESQAFVKAITANPELHAAYIAEKAGN